MSNEPTYTLDEAKVILARRECARYGHDISADIFRDASGAIVQEHVYCDRCGATFTEETRA